MIDHHETANQALARQLLDESDVLARAVADALYRERPDLGARHGAAGRARCRQDIGHNLEFVASAVSVAEPRLFADYVGWLRDMLGARGIDAVEIRRSLELTEAVVRERLPDDAEPVARCLRAGIARLSE